VLILFTIGVLLYALGVRVAAWLGNPKAKQWVDGRKLRAKLPETVDDLNEQWIWFHAASLGEFEQGRPVIEALKQRFPQYKILLTFFSPSGYEVRKDYPMADEVAYLPTDTPSHAAQWVRRHHFVAAFFIKYEFWFNYMRALKKAGIPLFYISLILKPDSFFFRPYGRWFRKQLHTVTHFFVQDEATVDLLRKNGFDNVTLCGDTRFDRVAAIAEQAKPFPDVERFIAGRQCIIAGSTWPPDEKLLQAFLPKMPDDYCLILAPHDISASHVAQIKAMFPDALLYTEVSTPCHTEAQTSESMGMKPPQILVINTIGILSQLYQYARFVYIGGGFGVGIHNILEAVTFGKPVFFGPNYHKFQEAHDIIARGGGWSISDSSSLDTPLSALLSYPDALQKASQACKEYMNDNLGSTVKILKTIDEK